MSQKMINYGIDLGTTNSSISRMEKGIVRIIKTDTLKDTMPSCVYFNKKGQIQIGDSAYNAMKKDRLNMLKKPTSNKSDSFIEFKRTMGTDKKYNCEINQSHYSSEELSAEVLKKLKSFINDDVVNAVIVTIPAKFTINQKDATRKASELAGFEYCELLQEPIAASIAYGLNKKTEKGYWLVFDFGGGTFDVVLVKLDEGIMKIIDTDGDNYLGGKNLDYAIVDEIIIKYFDENYNLKNYFQDKVKKELLRNAMKFYAEETKIQMSFNEEYNILSDIGDIPLTDDDNKELELDILLNQKELKKVFEPIFQKAITISKELLRRNRLKNEDLDALILVGGPTYSPILRKMIEEQIIKPDANIDPMTVVAKGSALYASTIEIPEEVAKKYINKEKVQIQLGYEATTVEKEELVTVRINQLISENDEYFVDIVKPNKEWSSGKKKIDTEGDVIEVSLMDNEPNHFSVLLYNKMGNRVECQPNEFTIIQGSKVGNAILPYNIGIEIKSIENGRIIFKPVKGLEKNQPIPAIGTINALKTQIIIRPGIPEDQIVIPIYQGEHDAVDSRAIYNEHIYDVVISGEDIPSLLPEDSDVDLTIKIDRSEKISLSAYFPILDYTHELKVPVSTTQKEIDESWLQDEINKAKQQINMLSEDTQNDDEIQLVKPEIKEIEKRFEQGKTDYDRKKEVLDNLRRTFRKIDKINDNNEWPLKEEELNKMLNHLNETYKQYGDEEYKKLIEQIENQAIQIIKDKNVNACNEIIDQIRNLDFMLVDKGMGVKMEIALLLQFEENFELHEWRDKDQANELIRRGLQIAQEGATKEELRRIVIALYKLLPESDCPISSGNNDRLLG